LQAQALHEASKAEPKEELQEDFPAFSGSPAKDELAAHEPDAAAAAPNGVRAGGGAAGQEAAAAVPDLAPLIAMSSGLAKDVSHCPCLQPPQSAVCSAASQAHQGMEAGS
jgi:hypothetical protein